MWLRRAMALCILAGIVSCSGQDQRTAEQLVKEGVTELGYVNFDLAYALFSKAMAKAPEGSEVWQQAIFGKATAAQQVSPATKSKIDEATKLFEFLVSRCPESKFAPRAMMNLGRIAEVRDYGDDKPDLPGARVWYQKVLDEALNKRPDDPIAGEAKLRVATTYVQTYEAEQVRQGIKMLEEWLASHPKEELASTMWQYLGDSYFYPLKDYPKSIACYDKADAIGWMDPSNVGGTFWRIANLAEKQLKDQKVAIKYYTKLITETPHAGKAYEASLALKRLGLTDDQIPKPRILQGK